jgi:hypothetical protein
MIISGTSAEFQSLMLIPYRLPFYPSNTPLPSLTDCAPSAKSPSATPEPHPARPSSPKWPTRARSCSSPKTHLARSVQPHRRGHRHHRHYSHLPRLDRATPPRSAGEAASGTSNLLLRPTGQRTRNPPLPQQRHRQDLRLYTPIWQSLPRTVATGDISNPCGYSLP